MVGKEEQRKNNMEVVEEIRNEMEEQILEHFFRGNEII